MRKTVLFLFAFVSLEFSACIDQMPGKHKSLRKKENNFNHPSSTIESDYSNWKSVKRGHIEFKYPRNWQVKIKRDEAVKIFQIKKHSDTSSMFFPISIYEFYADKGSYDDFSKNITYQYFIRETDGKNGNLISTEPTFFKNLLADDFEYEKNGKPVEIITVNGISKYYMLVNYTTGIEKQIAVNIFNSITITQ